MEVGELIEVIRAIKDPVAAPMVDSADRAAAAPGRYRPGYLSLDRETDTLSGGESQRVKIVKHLSSSLVDVMYIFDEPSVGLHPRDVHRMNELLQKLRDKGNTVIVVEHDPDVIKVADHIVDVGPHAGSRGGTIVYEGSFAGLLKADTLTGKHMQQSMPIKSTFRTANGKLSHQASANVNNLQECQRRYSNRRADRRDRRGRLGQKLADQRSLPAPAPRRDRDRPVRGGHLDPLEPRHLYRHHGRCSQSLCDGNKVRRGLVQLQLQRRLRELPGLGVIYTDLAFLDSVKSPAKSATASASRTKCWPTS